MTGYLIAWAIDLVIMAGFVGYFVRKLDRAHRQRLARINSVADKADMEFEVAKRAWAEQDARDAEDFLQTIQEMRAILVEVCPGGSDGGGAVPAGARA